MIYIGNTYVYIYAYVYIDKSSYDFTPILLRPRLWTDAAALHRAPELHGAALSERPEEVRAIFWVVKECSPSHRRGTLKGVPRKGYPYVT